MRLLNLGPEGVQKLLDTMETDSNEIKTSALKLSWYMRGGVSYEDILNMSTHERTQLNEIVKSNLETTKKTNLPFY
jgi:hypothetical protein